MYISLYERSVSFTRRYNSAYDIHSPRVTVNSSIAYSCFNIQHKIFMIPEIWVFTYSYYSIRRICWVISSQPTPPWYNERRYLIPGNPLPICLQWFFLWFVCMSWTPKILLYLRPVRACVMPVIYAQRKVYKENIKLQIFNI